MEQHLGREAMELRQDLLRERVDRKHCKSGRDPGECGNRLDKPLRAGPVLTLVEHDGQCKRPCFHC